MKKSIVLTLIFVCSILYSSPYLQVSSFDYSSEFPDASIKVKITAGIEESAGLNEDNLSVYENGFRVGYISVKSLKNEEKLNLILALDCSKSINSKQFEKYRNEANEIILSSQQNVRLGLASFSDQSDFESAFTDNKDDLKSKLSAFKQEGKNTLLYNSIYDSIELLSKNGEERKAVVIWTDGKDEGSGITADDLAFFSRGCGIPILFVTNEKSPALLSMKRIAKISGGEVFFEGKTDKLKRFIVSFKSGYEIKYKTSLKRGEDAKVEVRLKSGKIRDRSEIQLKVPEDNAKGFKFPEIKKSIQYILIGLAVFILFFPIILFLVYKNFLSNRKKYDAEARTVFSGEDKRKDYYSAVKKEEKVVFADKGASSDSTENSPDGYVFHAWFFVKEGLDKGLRYDIFREETIIGKSGNSDVVVRDNNISPNHARLKFTGDDFVLFDMASDGGTFLNGKKLLRPKKLFDWDEIQIGTTVLIFRVVSESAST
ncbi:MAG: FHA domain-containing protein [Spirochaetes bacterium]|nr:FHA domain-containing protein [Spirochaetota bacterium]